MDRRLALPGLLLSPVMVDATLPLRTVYTDERVVVSVCDDLLIAVWLDAPTIVQMEAFATHGRALERELPRGAVLSNLAVSGTPKFDERVRRLAAELTADPELFRIARSHTVLVGGMRGVAIRAFIQTFILLGRPPRPTKAFSAVEQAASWIAEQLAKSPHRWTPARVLEAHRLAQAAAGLSV
ncbi:MAG: hypothetical protein ACPG4T_00510 [Nannocystaceae bacterium]